MDNSKNGNLVLVENKNPWYNDKPRPLLLTGILSAIIFLVIAEKLLKKRFVYL